MKKNLKSTFPRVAAALILMSLSVFLLVSCAVKPEESYQVKSGMYVCEGTELGPYVFFNTDDSTWRTGAGLAISYSIGGTYRVDGNRITAKSDSGKDMIIMEITSETEITAVSVDRDNDELNLWISPNDVFRYSQPEDSSD